MTDPRTASEALRKMAERFVREASGLLSNAAATTFDWYREACEQRASVWKLTASLLSTEAERLESLDTRAAHAEAKGAELTEEDRHEFGLLVHEARRRMDYEQLGQTDYTLAGRVLDAAPMAGFTITRKAKP